MKKRILSLIMIMPFIAMLLAFGFSNTINLFVDLGAEYLEWEYDEQQAFEFTNDELTTGKLLDAVVYPLNATNKDIVWTCTDVQAFDGGEISAENPIAKIENGKLYKLRDGAITITATVKGSSVTKTFRAFLINQGDTSSEAKFVIVQGVDTGEVSVKASDFRDYGLYNLVNGSKVKAVETFKATVYPRNAVSALTATVINENAVAGCVSLAVSEIDENGECTISATLNKDSGGNYVMLSITAEGTDIRSDMMFRVIDGVNVRTYEDLMYCTAEQTAEKIVLRKNLESSENVKTRRNSSLFGVEENGKVVCQSTSMPSTYDVKYYTNQNQGDKAIVHVGVTFRDDVYGNGYTINAHELTYPSEVIEKTDANGNITQTASPTASDLFAGPLKFVSDLGCSCSGQDNIGFLVKGDNITIDNVTLKNCNNVSNLSNLDYVGTVLEVMGDNVTLQNSIVQNGRTVIRTMSNENFRIEACMLSYAREFILKVGSNRFVYPEPGQKIPSGREAEYNFLAPAYDENGDPLEGQFDSTATVKNTYFHTSGIFCVGMDTHFAGYYLYNRSSAIKNLAATSYPSKLTLEGDVKFFDWKTVSGLDSTTLIQIEGDEFSDLFNISEIIEQYHAQNPDKNIVLDKDGVHYVHGGVAFFGGGRNLSKVIFDALDDTSKEAFNNIQDPLLIGLQGLGTPPGILESAAGSGMFKFYMYNPNYEGITVGSMPEVSDLAGYYVG